MRDDNPFNYDEDELAREDGPDKYSGEFDRLCEDLNAMHEWRAERRAEEQAKARALAERARRTTLRERPPRSYAELKRQAARMAAREAAAAAAWEAEREASVARARAAKVAAHREMLRAEIPDLLSKALSLQVQGKCAAIDIARLQAECNHLAEQWRL